jgi:hypothetical protein
VREAGLRADAVVAEARKRAGTSASVQRAGQ